MSHCCVSQHELQFEKMLWLPLCVSEESCVMVVITAGLELTKSKFGRKLYSVFIFVVINDFQEPVMNEYFPNLVEI